MAGDGLVMALCVMLLSVTKRIALWERLPAAMRGRLNRGWKPLPQGWKWKIKVITQGAMMEGEEGATKYAKCAKRQASV
jgi:hypothetical protein